MPSLIHSAKTAREEFVLELGREPTHAELAASLGITTDRLRVVLSAAMEPVSLDREFSRGRGQSDQRTLADVIPDDDQNPLQEVENRMARQTLARSLHPHLSAEEHAVICSVYNLIEDRKCPLTYAEIGVRYGKSPEWAEKVEARALKKLKGRTMLRKLLETREIDADGYGMSS